MTIEPNDSFQDVLFSLRDDIDKGIYHPNEKLQPIYELSFRYQTSRETMKAVISRLVEENRIHRKSGMGVFVNPQPIYSSGIEKLGSVSDMIRKAGKEPGTQYVSAEVIEPTQDDLVHFHSLDVQTIARLERVRTADGEPVVYCIDKVDERTIPIGQIHNEQSIFKLIEHYKGKRIQYAHTFIEPIGYHEQISDILNCGLEQSLLLLKQIHYTEDDEPILYSANYFRSDAFQFHVVRSRMDE
ncbi:transcriptional regulator, GntR family [Pelagirhabdus alkalitolerans]|uniref:Transcriptional regulator, GntR family n=1 Tax=Pelagirhabdus alkalitolerans TaxID=1612202 RepID=A0A1G6H4Y9_9BACI|nr:GntR family transcriptional regulator [Pelagirhabdus alkalitolerans]SDB89168.1 transcriptional regulator, GntR family [Pelagirhabdus alkalitolerans]